MTTRRQWFSLCAGLCAAANVLLSRKAPLQDQIPAVATYYGFESGVPVTLASIHLSYEEFNRQWPAVVDPAPGVITVVSIGAFLPATRRRPNLPYPVPRLPFEH